MPDEFAALAGRPETTCRKIRRVELTAGTCPRRQLRLPVVFALPGPLQWLLAMPLVALVVGFALSFAQASGEPAVDLGGPLIVGGVEIPQDEIKRYLIYGPGRAELEYHRVQVPIVREIERRIREGGEVPVTREDFEVSEEDSRAFLDEKAADYRRAWPLLDLETEIRRAYRLCAWWEREKRQELQFDLVFIDDDPDRWPEVTYEAFRQEPQGKILIDICRESWQQRNAELEQELADWRAKVEAGDPTAGVEPRIQPEDGTYRSCLREIVRGQICQSVATETAVEGLAPELVCTMDFDGDGECELVLTTEEMWERIELTVTAAEVREARKFLALVEATRQRLTREGKLLDKAEVLARCEEGLTHAAGPGYRLVAPTDARLEFPSVEAFSSYLQLFESYRESVKPSLETGPDGRLPVVLQAHLEHANQVRRWGRVDAEVLLVSAFDFPNFRWKEDGWIHAARKAAGLAAALGEFPEAWSKLHHAHCEFWNPPQPEWSRGSQNTLYKHGGQFGCITRDYLQTLLDESPYSDFLSHGLLTDKIFFDLPLGVITGPYQGPWGYYLAKVLKRYPLRAPLDLSDDRNRETLREDWLRASFTVYAHEALDQAR